MNDLISVIVPVYKVEKYLDKCVKSIINQTYNNLEIILVDDGSPDKCPTICDEWARKDSRIKVIHQRNAGVSTARNAGLAIANGKYVCFVDSDDYVMEEYVAFLYEGLLDSGAELSVCNMLRDGRKSFDNDESLLTGILTNDYILLDYSLSGPCCKFYSNDLIKQKRLKFDENISYGEDTLFVLKYLQFVDKIKFVNKILYVSDSREDSLTSKHGAKEFNGLLYLLEKKKQFLDTRNIRNRSIAINNLVCLLGTFFTKVSENDSYANYLKRLNKVLKLAMFDGETLNIRQKIAMKMWRMGLCWPMYWYGNIKYRRL